MASVAEVGGACGRDLHADHLVGAEFCDHVGYVAALAVSHVEEPGLGFAHGDLGAELCGDACLDDPVEQLAISHRRLVVRGESQDRTPRDAENTHLAPSGAEEGCGDDGDVVVGGGGRRRGRW